MLLKKTIKILPTFDIYFLTINSNNFLVVSTRTNKKKYLSVPNSINIIKTYNSLEIISNLDIIDMITFNRFYLFLNTWLKRLDKAFKKALLLKGLGFKVSLLENNKILEFKLGYSHIIRLEIPQDEINITIEKNFIVVEGFDSVQVGNFITKIRTLRSPDSYKGKGFWYKNESIILKEVKKT